MASTIGSIVSCSLLVWHAVSLGHLGEGAKETVGIRQQIGQKHNDHILSMTMTVILMARYKMRLKKQLDQNKLFCHHVSKLVITILIITTNLNLTLISVSVIVTSILLGVCFGYIVVSILLIIATKKVLMLIIILTFDSRSCGRS